MTRGQRRTHLRVWALLAVVLPLLIAAGLWARRGSAGDRAGTPDAESRP